jgi:DNA-binding transcriptional LysR family regulator
MNRLEGKVALVTGGARGMGESHARRIVAEGGSVVIADVLDDIGAALATELGERGVEVITTSGTRAHRLDFAKCDLVIGATGYSLPGRSATLFTDEFVAVLDASNPILRSEQIDIRDIAKLPNATGYFGDQVATPVDRVFEELGITRTIAAQVSGLLALPLLVEGSDLVAFVPRLLARRAQRGTGLVVLEMPPGARVQLVEAMYWPAIRESDSASAWLRGALHRACLAITQPRELFAREMTNRVR